MATETTDDATLMRNIANELRKMKDGILSDFTGIGHERCAACLEDIADSYDPSSKSPKPYANPT